MSYQLKHRETLGENLRRVCRQQIEWATAIAKGEKKPKFPLPIRRFRKLQVVWEGSSKLHLDDELWPRKKQQSKQRREIEITVRPSALVILRPGRKN